jgi:protein TonB
MNVTAPITVPRAPSASDRDRLTTTIFLAALFHGIVIVGITFSAATRSGGAPGLEVALVSDTAEDVDRKTPAPYLAEVSQRGTGTTTERVAARTPAVRSGDSAQHEGEPGDSADAAAQASSEASEAVIHAVAQRPTVRYVFEAAPQAAEPARPLGGSVLPPLPQGNDVVAGVLLTGPKSTEDPLLLADTQASIVAPYLDSWRRKIERLGTLNYPTIARNLGSAASPVLEVEIGADGHVRQASIRRSSGYPALDQAALEILKLGSPFDPFPAELAAKYPTLQFAYEWQFDSGQPLQLRSAPP